MKKLLKLAFGWKILIVLVFLAGMGRMALADEGCCGAVNVTVTHLATTPTTVSMTAFPEFISTASPKIYTHYTEHYVVTGYDRKDRLYIEWGVEDPEFSFNEQVMSADHSVSLNKTNGVYYDVSASGTRTLTVTDTYVGMSPSSATYTNNFFINTNTLATTWDGSSAQPENFSQSESITTNMSATVIEFVKDRGELSLPPLPQTYEEAQTNHVYGAGGVFTSTFTVSSAISPSSVFAQAEAAQGAYWEEGPTNAISELIVKGGSGDASPHPLGEIHAKKGKVIYEIRFKGDALTTYTITYYEVKRVSKRTSAAPEVVGPLEYEMVKTERKGLGPDEDVVISVPLDTESASVTGTAGEFNYTYLHRIEKYFVMGCVVPKSEDCGSCQNLAAASPGSSDSSNSSVDIKFTLGKTLEGQSAGYLAINEKLPVEKLVTPAGLNLVSASEEVTTSIDGGSNLSAVYAPQTALLVEVLSTNAYKLKFYEKSGANYLTNDPPFVSYTVEDPDMGATLGDRVKMTEVRGALTNVSEFVWSSETLGWTLTKGNGLREEKKENSWNTNNTIRTEIRTVKNPSSGALLEVETRKYQVIGGLERLVELVQGQGAEARTNSYTYYSDGKTKDVYNADGSWSITQYDGNGRVSKVFTPFQNSAPTTTEANCRVVEYAYGGLGGDDDGSWEANSPRTTVTRVLGTEVSRSYRYITPSETREIQCITPGAAWDAAENLVTTTTKYAEGDFAWRIAKVERPDGVISLYEYEFDVATNLVTTVYRGAPGVGGTNVVDGVKTVTIHGAVGETLSVSQIDIASNILIGQETYSEFDAFKRPGKITYLNGASKTFVYSCCNLESETDENGIETVYSYDALKRRTSVTRAGVSTINIYDAANRTVAMWRQGTNSTMMLMSSNVYNTASELVTSYDALENETSYSRSVDGSGVRTETVTHPDQMTSVTTYFRDGSQKSVGGEAQHGMRYEYGVETDGGVARTYTKQFRLLENGTDSSEWVKSYTDAVGNNYKMLYPDGATNVTYFNSKGQAWKSVDADGVVRLSQYNSKGQREYTVLDVDRDDTVDFDGTDRITRSLSYATNAHGVDVLRSETWQWQTLGANTPVLLSTSDRSVETKESWQFAFGLTNYSIHVCVTNLVVCYSTNVAPDGSYTVSMAQYGLPLSSTRYDSNGVQLAQQSMGYDEFNRTITVTDARTGTITNTLDALGRTLTRTTPAPAPGLNPQTTQMDYDVRGRLWRVIEPDGGMVVTTYHPTGELKMKAGNRTYPVEYSYDYAGRMKTLKTWQDFDNDSGAAVTTWNYDSQRGFMSSKRYADNKGPDYTYTDAGRLETRTWARGIVTTYGYNNSGDLETVDYSDSTPDVSYTYDRVGRKATTTQGTQDAVTLHYTAAGQLAAEQHTSGLLSGITVTNAYDGLLRRTGLTVLTNGGSVYQALYGYDAASRMLTVSDGTNNATYSYVTDSSLVGGIDFKQNSTLRMTTTKQYDLLNRLTNISSTTASFTNSFAYLYNDANQRTKVTREDGSYWNYGYDDLGQVTSGKRYWADNTPVAGQQYDYDFDDIGNRKSTTQNAKPEIRNSLYTVNLLNQYTSRTAPGYADVLGTAHSNATVTVNYERAARKGEYWHKELNLNNQGQAVYAGVTNIAVMNDGANPDIVTTNTGNLFLPQTPEQFTYDDDGNLIGDGRWTYTWDGENRLIQMETKTGAVSAGTPKQKLEFAYDDQWRRIQKKVSDWNESSYTATYTNRFAYDGWNLLTVFNPESLKKSFLWGNDLSGEQQEAGGVGGLVAVEEVISGRNFVASDGNGSTVSLVGSGDGNLAASYEYGPVGELIQAIGTLASLNPFRFSTKYQDKETALIYYGYRYFTPILSRWLSRDPSGEEGGINIFSASSNNLINIGDFLGLYELKWEGGYWSPNQKNKVKAAIGKVKAELPGFIAFLEGKYEEASRYGCCPYAEDWMKALNALIAKMKGMQNALDGNTPLKLFQKNLKGKYGEAKFYKKTGAPMFEINIDESFFEDPEEAFGTMFHELSHYEGTEDPEFDNGEDNPQTNPGLLPTENAYTIEGIFVKKTYNLYEMESYFSEKWGMSPGCKQK